MNVMQKPEETSMYKRSFLYSDRRMYYVLSGLYKGYLCYTCGDGLIRSEFGNPINNKYIENLIPIPIEDSRDILSLKPSKRARLVSAHKRKISKKENQKQQ